LQLAVYFWALPRRDSKKGCNDIGSELGDSSNLAYTVSELETNTFLALPKEGVAKNLGGNSFDGLPLSSNRVNLAALPGRARAAAIPYLVVLGPIEKGTLSAAEMVFSRKWRPDRAFEPNVGYQPKVRRSTDTKVARTPL